MMIRKIRIFDDGFEQRSLFQRRRIQWRDVASIYGTSMDKVTYQEYFLKVVTKDNHWVTVGEFDGDFATFENELTKHIDGFPRDWRSLLELLQATDFRNLWFRS
jgi:hypothetical protein